MMDYSKLDKTKVYVAFSSGNTWLSKLIKFFTRSKFSHSFLLMWQPDWNTWLALGDD